MEDNDFLICPFLFFLTFLFFCFLFLRPLTRFQSFDAAMQQPLFCPLFLLVFPDVEQLI